MRGAEVVRGKGPYPREAERVRAVLVDTRKGKPSLKVILDDGTEKAIHSLYDPESEAKRLVDGFHFDGKGLVVVLGLGLGYHVRKLLRRFPDLDLVVVEASQEIYDLAVRAGITEGLSGSRILVAMSREEVLREITKRRLEKGVSSFSILSLPAEVSTFSDYYSPILSSLKASLKVRLWDRLRYRKFTGERVRALLIDSGYFLVREIREGMERLGHDVRVVGLGKGEGFISSLLKEVVDFRPDFLITVNHLGFDEEGILTGFLRSVEMPVASWYVDSPDLIIRAFERNVAPNVSLFLWDRGYVERMREMGFEDVHYLPLGTDERVFRPLPERGRIEVGFAGNSWVSKAEEAMAEVPEDLRGLVEGMAEDLYLTRDLDMLKEAGILRSLSPRERMALEKALLCRATVLYRTACIRALRDFRPVIHGDPAWRRLLGKGFRIRPPIHYYLELPGLYNSCVVNFNTTHLQMPTAVNQRVFDVPACGGFLLTDWREALEDLFEVGEEVAVYRDVEEIPHLVRYYLTHDDERERMARRGRERVLKEHTYTNRLKSLVDAMRKRYNQM